MVRRRLGASVEKLLYLPEAHTDFLLAVIAEELGFAGVALVIALFMWLLFRTYAIGRQAARLERPFAALVAQGVGVWIGVQAFINIGVNMGVLPTKGSDAAAVVVRRQRHRRQLPRARDPDARRFREPPAAARVCRLKMIVMITTGGTGGHVFPGLAVAAKLAARGAGVFWLGTRDGIEARLVPQHGVDFEGVSFRGVRGKGLRTLVFGPFALLGACVDARKIIGRRKPDVVLGFGGFASFPGGLMGTAASKPLVLHDANAVAGLATRVLAYGADRILLGFPQALKGAHAKRVLWVGNPLRDSVCTLPAAQNALPGAPARCACWSWAAAWARKR